MSSLLLYSTGEQWTRERRHGSQQQRREVKTVGNVRDEKAAGSPGTRRSATSLTLTRHLAETLKTD